MNPDICKSLYPSRIYFFSEHQLYTQTKPLSHLLSGCRGHVMCTKENTHFINLDQTYS